MKRTDPGNDGEDEYRAREHDHLVEPFFGGLGAEAGKPLSSGSAAPAEEHRADEPARARGPWERLLAFLRLRR